MPNKRRKLTVPQEFWNNFIVIPLLSVFICVNLAIINNIQFLGKSLWTILQPEALLGIGLFELILAVWMVILGRITIHRIAGPMVSFRKGLNQIGQGNLTTMLQFRKNDFYKEIADVFNENVEQLRQQVSAAQHLANQLEAELPDGHSSQEIAQKLQQQLDYFQTKIEVSQD